MNHDNQACCSFCFRPEQECEVLIASNIPHTLHFDLHNPAGCGSVAKTSLQCTLPVNICDECVNICLEQIKEAAPVTPEAAKAQE